MSKQFHQHKLSFTQWFKEHIILILLPALLLTFNRFWYLLARLITHTIFTSGHSFFEWPLPIDHEIPFVSFFVIPYVLSFLYWIVIPFIIYALMGKKVFYQFVAATFLAQILGFCWLVFLPSKMTNIDYTNIQNYKDEPLWNIMNAMVYNNDLPDNLSPSFHVLCTFLPFVACWNKSTKTDKLNYWMILGTGLMFILVALGVLFVRQHYVVDVFSAMSLVLLAYLIVHFWKWDIFFSSINEWWILRMNGILSRGVVSNNKLIRKINLKYSASQITFIICFITISSIIAGVMIYFGIVSSLIGDPFQGLWRFGIDGLWK